MVADVAVPHTEGIFAEFRIGFFHLALEKILADHAGLTNFHSIPYVEDTHSSTFSQYLLVPKSLSCFFQLVQPMFPIETEGGRLAAFVIRFALYGLRCRLPAGRIQQRLEKFVKNGLLFRGQEIDVPLVVEQKGANADDCFCQIAGTGNALFYLIASFAQQVFQQSQV
jgi:hypothetical protein